MVATAGHKSMSARRYHTRCSRSHSTIVNRTGCRAPPMVARSGPVMTEVRPGLRSPRRRAGRKSMLWPAAERLRRPGMPETPTFSRYDEIPNDEMTPEQQEGYRSLIETRGPLSVPHKIWVHNPKLARAIGPLGGHFHPGQYSLTEREREIAVIITNSKGTR